MICSGSLLGIHYKRIESNSVGHKTDYQMSSMDFEDFLWAKGCGESAREKLLHHMETQTPLSESAMQVYGNLFLDYKKDDSTLEEDFFVRARRRLLPVGVKAKRGTAKFLRTLIQSDRYPDIRYGVKLTAGNIGQENGIYSFPYFCTFPLREYLKRMDQGNIPEQEA